MYQPSEPGLSALIIEDDTHERIAIRRALRNQVQSFLECENAEEALDRLEHSPSEFDVIISDLKLPGMDGLSLFRTIRQMKCSCPFILLTGNGSEQIAIEAFKAGIDDYLIKASHNGYLDILSPLVSQVVNHHRLKTRNELLELSLKEANDRFQQFMEQYQGIFWLTDYEEPRRLVYVSPNYEIIWDRPAQYLQLNSWDWLDAVHPHDRSRIKQTYLNLTSQKGFDETYQILRSDGSLRWIHDRGFLLTHSSGIPYRIVRLSEDITDRTTISEALKASEERFAQFMAHLPGLAYMKDEHYRYMYLNPSFTTTFNLPLNHWIGKTVQDVLPKDTAARLHQNDEWVLSRRESLETIEHIPLEDGPHQYLTVKFPILRHEESPIMGGVSIDITERLKAEMQRDQIFSLSPDLMCIIGTDGYLKKINPAFEKLLGYSQEELLSEPLIFFTHPDDRAATLAVFKQLAQENDILDFQTRLRNNRGNHL